MPRLENRSERREAVSCRLSCCSFAHSPSPFLSLTPSLIGIPILKWLLRLFSSGACVCIDSHNRLPAFYLISQAISYTSKVLPRFERRGGVKHFPSEPHIAFHVLIFPAAAAAVERKIDCATAVVDAIPVISRHMIRSKCMARAVFEGFPDRNTGRIITRL